MSDAWWLYAILCRGGGIYVGIAKDVDARYRKHAQGRGAFYTKLHPPLELLARKSFASQKEAIEAERAMKRLSVDQKRRAVFAMVDGDGVP